MVFQPPLLDDAVYAAKHNAKGRNGKDPIAPYQPDCHRQRLRDMPNGALYLNRDSACTRLIAPDS